MGTHTDWTTTKKVPENRHTSAVIYARMRRAIVDLFLAIFSSVSFVTRAGKSVKVRVGHTLASARALKRRILTRVDGWLTEEAGEAGSTDAREARRRGHALSVIETRRWNASIDEYFAAWTCVAGRTAACAFPAAAAVQTRHGWNAGVRELWTLGVDGRVYEAHVACWITAPTVFALKSTVVVTCLVDLTCVGCFTFYRTVVAKHVRWTANLCLAKFPFISVGNI